MKEFTEHYESVQAMGWLGPWVSIQCDATSTNNTEYFTVSFSWIPPDWSGMERVAVGTKAFPGRHTADDIELWIRQVSKFQIQHRLCGIGFWYSLRRACLHYVYVLVVSEPPTEDRVYSLILYSCDVLFSIYIKV